MRRSEIDARLDEIRQLKQVVPPHESEMLRALNHRIDEICITPVKLGDELVPVFALVEDEFIRATADHGRFTSFHHGASVLREEYEELWEQVKLKPRDRDVDNMRRECIQIMSAAAHFYTDLLKEKR